MKLWEAIVELEQSNDFSGSMTPAYSKVVTTLKVPDAGGYWNTLAFLEATLGPKGRVNALYEKF